MNKRHIASRGLTNTTYGLIGEHIAAAAILAIGWKCAMAQMDGVDLVAWNDETGQKLLIQVKSGQESVQKRSSIAFQIGIGGVKQPNGTKKKRLPTTGDFDILALVSSEQRTVFFMSVTDVKSQKITKQSWVFEDADVEVDSWNLAVEKFNETNTKQTTLRNVRNRGGSGSNS